MRQVKTLQGFIAKNKFLALYLCLLLGELALIHSVSDLPSTLGNWIDKSRDITGFEIPKDNFYGPGSAILMVPFLMIPNYLFLANLTYFGLGVVAFWKISALINHKLWRTICLFALPLNFYLIWLVNSSQDTVFEFFLLTWSVLFMIRKKYLLFSALAFLLCLTRAGYWVFFLGTSAGLFLWDKLKGKKLEWKKLIAIPLLVFSSVFNFAHYQSPSPALEGGLTLYFSYTKYHYLSLPKMDMDVFLSGPKGSFSEFHGPVIPPDATQAEVNAIYTKAAIDSVRMNPKETTLGWMQKFDSYFFDVQKIPHLPGAYVLNQDKKIIEIQDERLNWTLVLGNLAYIIWRTLFLLAGLVGLGILFAWRFLAPPGRKFGVTLWPLAFPYFFGAIPGMIVYTETRFKVVSEVLLVPLIVQIWSRLHEKRLQEKSFSEN